MSHAPVAAALTAATLVAAFVILQRTGRYRARVLAAGLALAAAPTLVAGLALQAGLARSGPLPDPTPFAAGQLVAPVTVLFLVLGTHFALGRVPWFAPAVAAGALWAFEAGTMTPLLRVGFKVVILGAGGTLLPLVLALGAARAPGVARGTGAPRSAPMSLVASVIVLMLAAPVAVSAFEPPAEPVTYAWNVAVEPGDTAGPYTLAVPFPTADDADAARVIDLLQARIVERGLTVTFPQPGIAVLEGDGAGTARTTFTFGPDAQERFALRATDLPADEVHVVDGDASYEVTWRFRVTGLDCEPAAHGPVTVTVAPDAPRSVLARDGVWKPATCGAAG